jgi:hypothetical protein
MSATGAAAYQLSVETTGGVADLSRVISVLALYDLTPTRLSVKAHGAGLRIVAIVSAEAQTSLRCAQRMAWHAAVARVACAPIGRRPAGARAAAAPRRSAPHIDQVGTQIGPTTP